LNRAGVRPTSQSSSGELNALSLFGGVVGAVGGVVGVVGGVVDPDVAVRPVTVTELALRVIPLINNLKAQLVEVQLALKVLSTFQTVINQLKEDFVVLNTKYGGLDECLVKTNAVLKSLDDWSIAYDFSRASNGHVPLSVKIPIVAPLIQANVSAYSNHVAVHFVNSDGKLAVASELVEMSIIDLDNMFV